MSETSVKIEISCRDDTMPKTVDTRIKPLQGMVESMQQSSATPSLHLGVLGLWMIVACSQPYLAVALATVFGTVSSLYTSYFDFYTCIIQLLRTFKAPFFKNGGFDTLSGKALRCVGCSGQSKPTK